ncbi:NYN domain-containing protein [Cetobacterium ceti]|uniref:NYN domain-containing protein n=1 Tax=Cetobacterium ceti TaxID=180163 RepID=A0A1T4K4Q4_9FUSO|nr:NYN domain-containing protein [Cetobacterium ceti]SJZ37411.1 NYN domain-containing protein [Cetobacterium ceti]
MERVLVVLDYFNFQEGIIKKYGEFNYNFFLEYLSNLEEGRKLIDAYGYIKLDYYDENTKMEEINIIEANGFLIKRKINYSREDIENNFYETSIIIEILKTVKELNIEIVVFLTRNTIYYPLFKYLRDIGIRVEIASIENFENEKLNGISQGIISVDEFLMEKEV